MTTSVKKENYDVLMAISDNETIKTHMRNYLINLIKFYIEHDETIKDHNKILLNYFYTLSPKVCGTVPPDKFNELLTGDIKTVHLRELLTPIMNGAQRIPGLMWEVFKQYEKAKKDKKTKKCSSPPTKEQQEDHVDKMRNDYKNKFNIDLDVIAHRVAYIFDRFGFKAGEIAELKRGNISYTKETSPYPMMTHATTQSMNQADQMTLYFERVYPRKRGIHYWYEQALDKKDARLDKSSVYPELSEREQKFIKDVVNSTPNNDDLFLQNLDDNKLPWQTGYLSATIHPNHVYLALAAKCKRYMILGPSGTTEFMLNVAEIFGVDLRIMTLACIPWMYYAKDHSLFEIMIMANKFFDPPIFRFDTPGDGKYETALKIDHAQIKDLLRRTLGKEAVKEINSGPSEEEEKFMNNINASINARSGTSVGGVMMGGEINVVCKKRFPSEPSDAQKSEAYTMLECMGMVKLFNDSSENEAEYNSIKPDTEDAQGNTVVKQQEDAQGNTDKKSSMFDDLKYLKAGRGYPPPLHLCEDEEEHAGWGGLDLILQDEGFIFDESAIKLDGKNNTELNQIAVKLDDKQKMVRDKDTSILTGFIAQSVLNIKACDDM